MGDIRKVLYLKELPKRTITPTKFWTDLCENFHLHLRNIRLDFSIREFKQLAEFVIKILPKVLDTIKKVDYKEGNHDFLAMFSTRQVISQDSDYYADRFSIELQKDSTIHIHYRDLRLHLSSEEFKELAEGFIWALAGYNQFKDVILPEGEQEIDINLIQPYDEGHKPLAEDSEHKEAIGKLKDLIKQGKKISPILIRPDGQRLDGYKRYMAMKDLGYEKIPCIVDASAEMGGQTGENWVING
jgi:hypothetical protein